MAFSKHYVDMRGLLMKELKIWGQTTAHKVNGMKEIKLENHNMSIVQPDDIVIYGVKIDSVYIK